MKEKLDKKTGKINERKTRQKKKKTTKNSKIKVDILINIYKISKKWIIFSCLFACLFNV